MIRFLWILGLSWAAALFAAEPVGLRFRAPDGATAQSFRVVGREVRVVKGEAVLPVSLAGKWDVVGDLRTADESVHWNPRFERRDLRQDSSVPLPADRSWRIRVQLGLLNPSQYAVGDADVGGIAVFLWIVRGQIVRICPVGIIEGDRPPMEEYADPNSVNFLVSDDEADGAAAVLYVQANGEPSHVRSMAPSPARSLARARAYADETLRAATLDAMVRARDWKENGLALLSLAARLGDVASVDALLNHGVKVDPFKPATRGPLQSAARSGRTEVIERLLRGNSYPVEYVLESTCEEALRGGHHASALAVLKHARLRAADRAADAPLVKHARYFGSTEILRELVGPGLLPKRIGAPDDALYGALRRNQHRFAEALIEGGFPTNYRATDGRTALHAAAQSGVESLVRALVRAKAELNAADDEGETPLLAAVRAGHPAVAELLLDLGAQGSLPDHSGVTAAHEAAARGNPTLLRRLVGATTPAAPGDLVRFSSGTEPPSPLALALRQRHAACVAVLVESGARLTTKDRESTSLLREAISLDQVQLVEQALADRLVPPEAFHGWSLLALAEHYGAKRTEARLRELGEVATRPPYPTAAECEPPPKLKLLPLAHDLGDRGLNRSGVRLKVRGIVTVEGRIRFPVVEGATDPRLEVALLEALERAQFDPAKRDGGAVAAAWEQSFQLPPAPRHEFGEEEVNAPVAIRHRSSLLDAERDPYRALMGGVFRRATTPPRRTTRDAGVPTARQEYHALGPMGGAAVPPPSFDAGSQRDFLRPAAPRAGAEAPRRDSNSSERIVRVTPHFVAEVAVEANGEIFELEIRGDGLDPETRARLEQAVRELSLSPAIMNGRAVRSRRTFVFDLPGFSLNSPLMAPRR